VVVDEGVEDVVVVEVGEDLVVGVGGDDKVYCSPEYNTQQVL
jgi:hypothetical protein